MNFLLADDHLIVRQGLQLIIKDLIDDAIFFHSSTIKNVLTIVNEETIDILILDAQFPDGVCLPFISQIKQLQSQIKILVFTSFEETDYAINFINAGADGYLSKLSEETEIKTAIHKMIHDGAYYSAITKNLLNQEKAKPISLINPLDVLSKRELQIAKLLTKGCGNLEISNELSLRQNTVSTFKKRIFKKLNISSIVDLIEIMKIYTV